MLIDESPDILCQVEELRPLLLVEGDRKAPSPIARYRPLLTYPNAHALAGSAFEGSFLCFEACEFGLQSVFSPRASILWDALTHHQVSSLRVLPAAPLWSGTNPVIPCPHSDSGPNTPTTVPSCHALPT